jgi:apolipoprotein N-acyltransferase
MVDLNQLNVATVAVIGRRYPNLIAFVLGALATTGFAPLAWWPVALLCFAGWIWLIHDAATLRCTLLRGWLFGFAHFFVGNFWMQQAFTFQDAMPHWLGYGAVAIAAAYLAIYPMLAGALAWRLASPRATGDSETAPHHGFVLVFGAAWIATEWLRSTIFTGYPWNPLGVIWVPTFVAAAAATIGTYALSGVTVALAGLLLPATWRRWRLSLVVVAATATLIVIGTPFRPTGFATLPARSPSAPHVRIIQPNLGEEVRPTDDYAENNLAAIERLLGTPGTNPRLIVWPEGALRFMIEDGYPPQYYWRGAPAAIRQRIAAHLGPNDIVLTGGNALKFDAAGNVRTATNSIFALDARGAILGRYDKAHLVPYGEYLPMRPLLSLIGLQRLVPGDLDFSPGPGPRDMALPGFGAVGMQICYEIIFSGQIVDPAHRPALIFNPSNDSWYGSWGPPEHLAQARMRAIEEGLPIVRATPTGISAIIAPDGRVLDSIPLGVAGAIEQPIPAAWPPTPFARLGNWAALIVAAMLLLFAVAIRRAGR